MELLLPIHKLAQLVSTPSPVCIVADQPTNKLEPPVMEPLLPIHKLAQPVRTLLREFITAALVVTAWEPPVQV